MSSSCSGIHVSTYKFKYVTCAWTSHFFGCFNQYVLARKHKCKMFSYNTGSDNKGSTWR